MKEMSLKEYKDTILQVLVKIDAICRENDIKYSLAYGTLLGAVRHQGYIPWDDDIDIMMPWDDYNRFTELVENKYRDLNIIRIENTNETCFPFGKACMPNTVVIEGKLKPIKNYGAYVDIFPMVFINDVIDGINQQHKKYFSKLRFASYNMHTGISVSTSLLKNVARYLEFIYTRFTPANRLINEINEAMVETNQRESEYIGVIWYPQVYPRDLFNNQVEVLFEGHYFWGTKDPDLYLKNEFGDYMKLPPEDERINKHGLKCYWTNK